jgi:IclR family transcriptional regulator, KDG regulon repressor
MVRKMPRTKPLASLEKGLDILSIFEPDSQEFSVQDISTLLNLPISTTYRYLDLLTAKGFLTKDARTRKLVLGPTIFKIGEVVSSRLNLGEIAHIHMDQLSKTTGETVFLTVANGWEAVCIKKLETTRSIRMSLPLGSTLPLHAGASAKVLLAYKSNDFVENLAKYKGLPKLTEHTVTDLAKLMQELREIRRQAYSISNSEADYGAIAIAAPIKDAEMNVVAGVSIGGPSERIQNTGIHKIVEMVKQSAEMISQDLIRKQNIETACEKKEP